MNPIFMRIGPVSIYWYSLFILIGLIIGIYLVIKEGKKHNLSADMITDLAFYMVPIALICARLYFVIFHFDYYSANLIEIFYVWEGGLAIHGGIIGGLCYLLYYSKKHKINPLLLTDIIVISLFLGQAIGRWGNFMNGEAFGPATTLEHLKSLHIPDFIIKGMNINNVYHIPTFFYESIGCFIGAFILILYRKRKQLKLGELTSFYLLWYGIIRFFIEGLRTDSLMLGTIKMAQLVSILMIIIGIGLFIYSYYKKKLYHEEVYHEI